MKSSIEVTRTVLIIITLVFLLYLFCYDFEIIDQPDRAAPYSQFYVKITVSIEEHNDSGIPHFGILLPVGWTVTDSILYTGVLNGRWIYSDAMSDSIENEDPAPNGYYWWVSVGDMVDSLIAGVVSFKPGIRTDNQTGTFFISYILGDDYSGFHIGNGFPSRCRSNDHPISVSAPMTVTVTNTNNSGLGSLRQALCDVSSGGEIVFNLSHYDTIVLDSQLVIDRNVVIKGPLSYDLAISGGKNDRVFYVGENLEVSISNLNLVDGLPYGTNSEGGAIYCRGSSIFLENISICKSAAYQGGGIYCRESNVDLKNVTLKNNQAYSQGGGIWNDGSMFLDGAQITNNFARNGGGIFGRDLELKNVKVSGNSAAKCGGGIYAQSKIYFDNVERCDIYLNSASTGNDLYNSTDSMISVVVDTFTLIEPFHYQVYPVEKFTLDIFNTKVEQVNSDLYVNPAGDDRNSGLSADDPLKTVFYAMNKILADSLNPRTIYLANGVYSAMSSGDSYPIRVPPYVSLCGESGDNVILDAEGYTSVIISEYNPGMSIKNMIIRNGLAGIICRESEMALSYLCISDNSGEGIQCEDSDLIILNSTICKSDTGIYCVDTSYVNLVNTIVWFNSREIKVLSGSVVNAFFCDVRGSYPGLSNIFSNPMFVDTANGDYRLQASSPCINAGTAFYMYAGDTLILLQPWQYNGSKPDMGAFEFGLPLGITQEQNVPKDYALQQNYPNPFNPTTIISWQLPVASHVKLKVYNITGEEVATLLSASLLSGAHSIEWDASGLASGVYLYRLEAEGYVETRKMVLMK